LEKQTYLYPLVIFDLDGTVIESDGNLLACINYALNKEGFPSITRQRLKPLIGYPLDYVFRLLLEERGYTPTDKKLEQLGKNFKYYSDQNLIEDTAIYEGIPQLLHMLGKMKILTAIGTTKPTDKAREILEALHLINSFDHVQGTDGFPYKPDPHIIFTIQKYFQDRGYILSETFMVGDTLLDIEAGNNASATTILVNYGFHSHQDDSCLAKSDYIASTSEEILHFIKKSSALKDA